MTDKHTIAIIPARGGSKRIPQKNMVDFMGKPMIAWTIEAAIEANIFKRILVSTDDDDIANVAREFGAEVPFLRNSDFDDITPVSKATIIGLKQAMNHWKESYSSVVQLMANCPIRNGSDILDSLRNFNRFGYPFQISCTKFGWLNPWWATTLDASNTPRFLHPESLTKRSQDLEELYCPTGSIWIADVKKLLIEGTFYGKGYKFFPIDWKSAVDIDNYEDLEFAKAVSYLISNGL